MNLLERYLKNRSEDLSKDPRWKRFNDSSYTCPCCSQSFSGVYDIGFDHPGPWPHGNRETEGIEDWQVGDDRLTPDLCKVDQHFFVRCVLYLPIRGADEEFGFGCWGSLSEDNFRAYVANARTGDPFDGAFSWLANDLPCFESNDGVPCDLEPGAEGQRPRLFAHQGHPLADAQRDGISFDTLLDIYARAGNDLRPHLSDA